jgi:hypothetical protein
MLIIQPLYEPEGTYKHLNWHLNHVPMGFVLRLSKPAAATGAIRATGPLLEGSTLMHSCPAFMLISRAAS